MKSTPRSGQLSFSPADPPSECSVNLHASRYMYHGIFVMLSCMLTPTIMCTHYIFFPSRSYDIKLDHRVRTTPNVSRQLCGRKNIGLSRDVSMAIFDVRWKSFNGEHLKILIFTCFKKICFLSFEVVMVDVQWSHKKLNMHTRVFYTLNYKYCNVCIYFRI